MSANNPAPKHPEVPDKSAPPPGPRPAPTPRFAPGSDEEHDWVRDEELLERELGGSTS